MRMITKLIAGAVVAGSLVSGGFAVGHVTASAGVYGCKLSDGTILPTGDAARFGDGVVRVCGEDGTLARYR